MFEEPQTKEPKTIKMRRWSYDDGSVIEVTLEPNKFSTTEWEVLYKGGRIGRVGSYTGSLDRKAGRLRIPGKRRKLWYADRSHGYVSRADAIRTLLSGVNIDA